MNVDSLLNSVAIILKDTTHPGNIGSSARAMKAMGLSHLSLVSAQTQPLDETAIARAAGADDILEAATSYSDLPSALKGHHSVFALTSRRRDISPPLMSVREATQTAVSQINAGYQIAFLFGGERSGLENKDIQQCNTIVEIPTSSAYSSLNLSQAVQIVCYELRMATGVQTVLKSRELTTRGEFEAMMTHMEEALNTIGLPKVKDNRSLLVRLRRLLSRLQLEHSEVLMLRGIWRAIIQANDKNQSK